MNRNSSAASDAQPIPLVKRVMRSVWSVLPRTGLSFNVGKLITRTLLRPERMQCITRVQFSGRIPMTLDLGTFVANDLFCLDDHYESVTLRLWRSLARDAGTILDIGSHIGTFALVAADANPRARVICVEADGTIFESLCRNASPFPNIVTVHAAIADRESQMWFCPVGGNDGGGFLSPDRPDEPQAYAIETHTLSRLCSAQNVRNVDLMKMDVEGFEQVLLTQDNEFFNEFAPSHIIVELTIDKRSADRSGELFAAMRRRGYTAKRIQGLYAIPFGKTQDLANWHFSRVEP